jgi:vancomycin resistance protein YoaR
MNTVPTQRYVRPRATPASPLGQALVALILGLGLFGVLLAGLPTAYGMAYQGRIYPGVSVAGIDLSKMSVDEAATLLAQRLDYPQRGKIVFQEGSNLWVATPGQLGLFVDIQSSARAAYTYGRSGGLTGRLRDRLEAWFSGVNLPPLFVFDERIAQNYIEGIAAQIDRPIIEASLGISGVDVVVHSGQVGRKMDVQAALTSLSAQIANLTDGMIPLVVDETPPVILDVTAQAELARQILSASLVLKVPGATEGDPGPWTFEPGALAAMLAIERVESSEGARYQVGLSSANLRTFLEGVAPNLVRYPVDARFIFNDDTRQLELIQNAVIGRSLDIEASLQAINQKLAEGQHEIDLVIQYTDPAVKDDATAQALGITEAVSVYNSYFYGSSAERIQNIQIASARFHGVLVAPGATLSMADILGEVSFNTGYSEAWIIYGDRTIKGVGGGVCQVSTTLFRTAFFGGYEIDERYPHAYRVGYYEQTASGGYDSSLAGLDATVFAPVVDFKFTNDTQYWLLMETYVDPAARRLTWKFYSTSDGRTVEWHTSGLTNIVEALDPLYEENPDLAAGVVKQVDWAVEGADVTVTRSVTRDGQVIHEDTFNTHYLPWRDIFQYGPGTEGMPPEPTETPNPY